MTASVGILGNLLKIDFLVTPETLLPPQFVPVDILYNIQATFILIGGILLLLWYFQIARIFYQLKQGKTIL